ncbi:MAG: MazG family protein [Actinobacteria bacterium]|nr:MazG family protein [Actinomycetota bacterium]
MTEGPRRLYLVGLGPGPADLMTLKGWELLASGKHLVVNTTDHKVLQAILARGFHFELVPADPEKIAPHLIEAVEGHGEVVYACPGQVFESPEVISITRLAAERGVAVEVVPAVSDWELVTAADSATAAHSGPQAIRAGSAFTRLVSVMARLRAPDGCPWDREQTHASLAIHLLEEAHETLDAIDRGDMRDLEEELGDLLLQIVFHAEIADESDDFEAADVVDGLVNKLIHRHPHIFGDVDVSSSQDVVVNWEALKHEQKERASIAEGIPSGLPALLFANKVQRRIAGQSREFDLDPSQTLTLAARLVEDGKGESSEEILGELLYHVVAVAQSMGLDPEGSLRKEAARRLRRAASKPSSNPAVP